MAFTEKELEFIDNNSELIEKGPGGIQELVARANLEFGMKNRLKLLLVYNCLGTNGFEIRTDSYLSSGKIIYGAIFNRTTFKAKGEPLMPSMYKAKTKVRLYKISSGKIVDSKTYVLEDKPKLDQEVLSGGYNLGILDRPENVKSVENCFNGELTYSLRLIYAPNIIDREPYIFLDTVETNTDVLAEEALLESVDFKLTDILKDFTGVKDRLVSYIRDNLSF